MCSGVHNTENTTRAHLPERQAHLFWAKVRRTRGCWLWTAGKIGSFGYGQFRGKYAHRVAWEMANGPIPEGLSCLHHCDVALCVRPEHLFLGTQLDNMRDAASKGRLHVPRPRRQKLSVEQLAQIDWLAESGFKQVDIARNFGVSKTFISLYLKGKRRQYDRPAQLKKQVGVAMPTYSNTTHGRFIEHMDLARAWAQRNGRSATAQRLSDIMRMLSADELRQRLATAGVKVK